jgi:hypothetical protein
MFRLFGESLAVARLPGVIAGAVLVGVVFSWVRREAGRTAAWITGLMLCFNPYAIADAQILRFYPVHALLFWLAALGVYRLATRPSTPGKAAAIAVGSIASFGVSTHLQPLVAVGGLALVMWLAAVRGPGLVRWLRATRARGMAATAVVVVAAGVALLIGLPARLASAWSLFRYADYWAFANRENVRYYYDLIGAQLGPLWPAVPALFAIAAVRRPRPTCFAGTIFATAFLFHSLAAWKTERYLHYATAALFIVIGIAIAELVPLAYRGALEAARRAGAGQAGRRLASLAAGVVVVATTLAVLDAADATRASLRILTKRGVDRPPPYNPSDWRAARVVLQSQLDDAEVVIASSDLKSLYFLGRLDYDLFAAHLYSDAGFLPDFTIHARTGIPAIRTANAVRRIIACHATGIIVAETRALRVEYAVQAATADAIEAELSSIQVPDRIAIRAWSWRHEPDPTAVCPPAPTGRVGVRLWRGLDPLVARVRRRDIHGTRFPGAARQRLFMRRTGLTRL